MQLCSVIWIPCGINLEANLDEAVICFPSHHLPSFHTSRKSPTGSNGIFPFRVLHHLPQTHFNIKKANFINQVLHGGGRKEKQGQKLPCPDTLHRQQHPSRKAILWADSLQQHFPFPRRPRAGSEGEKLCGCSLGNPCAREAGERQGGEQLPRKQRLSYPCCRRAEVRGCRSPPLRAWSV